MHVKIIAECGVNHNGSLTLAKKLIDQASSTGADYVKFQSFNAENLVSKKAVKLAKQNYETEASGGVTLGNIKSIAATNVDRVSVGELTHSFNSLDLKLEI